MKIIIDENIKAEIIKIVDLKKFETVVRKQLLNGHEDELLVDIGGIKKLKVCGQMTNGNYEIKGVAEMFVVDIDDKKDYFAEMFKPRTVEELKGLRKTEMTMAELRVMRAAGFEPED